MPPSVSRIARGPFESGIFFALLLLLQMSLAAGARAATLPQLFPALANLPETTTLVIELGWQGLSRLSPFEGNYLLELQNDQFEGTGHFRVATLTASRPIAVPRDAVRAFFL